MASRIEPLYYYKWMWKDWRSNRRVQRMHFIARGLYRELLDEQFIEGSIPDDIEALAEICGCPIAVMKEYWPEIAPHFTKDENGNFVHPKMETVRTELDSIRVKASDAGRKSAQLRNGRSTPVQRSFNDLDIHRSTSKRQSRVRAESETEQSKSVEPPPKPAVTMQPLDNPDVSTLVRQIVISHPKSLMCKMRFGEVNYAQTAAVLKAMEDEMDWTGKSAIECLADILRKVEAHARDIPLNQYQFLKDVPDYFASHQYRAEAAVLSGRNGNGGASESKGIRRVDEAFNELRKAGVNIQDRRPETGADEVRDTPRRGHGRGETGIILEGSG